MMYRFLLLFVMILIISGCSGINDILNNDAKDQTSTIDKASDERGGLDRHNEIRAEVFSGSSLSWSDEMAKDAQSHADNLASSGKFEHDSNNYSNGPYGENLYASTANGISFRDAIDNWYVEKDFYDYVNNSCKASPNNKIKVGITEYDTCGHYTQIIWKDTGYIGCAKAKYQTGSLKGGYIVVCKYKNPGNTILNNVNQRPY